MFFSSPIICAVLTFLPLSQSNPLAPVAPVAPVSPITSECWRDTECRGPANPSWPGSWDKYNYSPSNRIVAPTTIFRPNFEQISKFPSKAKIRGEDSSVIYDFGKLVAGIVTVTYSANTKGTLGLAFTEARNWTGKWSDSSNGSFQPDGAVVEDVTATREATFIMPDSKTRGGFRYLTIFIQSGRDIELEILNVSVEISFQPDWPNLRAYRGYFHSSDDLLKKIWYSGAYTLQTNAIPPEQGRQWPILGAGWKNANQCNIGTEEPVIYVDGSKRDRTVWAGDLAIAVPSILVSTGDWDGVRNTLQVLFNDQRPNGELPFAGPPINIYGSDTYHCATLIGTTNFITNKTDSTGLLFVTGNEDWGPSRQRGYNSEANMLMYRVLTTGSAMAGWMGDQTLATIWVQKAAKLKKAVNKSNFDQSAGAFKDSNTDASINPQDTNSMSLLWSIAPSKLFNSISNALTKNWTPIGAVAPELPNNLVGFIQSIEVKAHLQIRSTLRGLTLIRNAWGWYLNHPSGTQSTCVEGYPRDGTFGYRSSTGYANDASYTSHAHGWSTGPTDALTSYIAGLTFTQPGGQEWRIAPQFGDLSFAEAGVEGVGGSRFYVKWMLTGYGYFVEYSVPVGTKGEVVLPGMRGKLPRGVVVDEGRVGRVVGKAVDERTGTMTIDGLGGKHSIKVRF